jgi:hypothetical protein
VIEQGAAVLEGRVEEAAVASRPCRHLGEQRHREGVQARGVGVGGGDDPCVSPGSARRGDDPPQRCDRLAGARQPLQPDLHEDVAELRRRRGDSPRFGVAGRAGRGAHRTLRIEHATGVPRGPENRGRARAERTTPRVLQVDDRGPGAQRRDRLFGVGNTRQKERRCQKPHLRRPVSRARLAIDRARKSVLDPSTNPGQIDRRFMQCTRFAKESLS